ncbi:MAG: HD domain-containing protein [Halobacteriovoraceae bacterium]|jgi:HD-GYP domain-containing protein (c-di-GMP phosphodiesterase class II)|nr:HD domain-containing protein [Halobacteriovoraceae bacterium]
MKTTLIVESNIQFQDFYSINLHTWIGANCVLKDDAKFAIEHLQKDPSSIKLIITRAKVGTERSAEAIYEYLAASKLEIPIIVIGQSPLMQKVIVHIKSALEIKALIQAAAKALNVTAQEMAEAQVDDYFPIPIQHFYLIKQSICNVFLEDEDQPKQFKLFLNELGDISATEIKILISNKVSYLHVEKINRLKFVTNINQEIAAKLELKDLNEDEKTVALEMSLSLLQEKMQRMGITDETVELGNRNLRGMVQSAKNVPNLKHLLRRLLKNKSGYQYKHSQVLMFVATQLMDQLDWVNKEQRDKLQFIAFFHDIALQNSEQARIHTKKGLREANFNSEEKELVNKHAHLSAALAAQYPNAPIGVEQIIKQHHGMTNGIGFSEHYSQNISPMAIVFILAEDFVDSLMYAEKNFSITKKIAIMRETYTTQRFQKIINALESITI